MKITDTLDQLLRLLVRPDEDGEVKEDDSAASKPGAEGPAAKREAERPLPEWVKRAREHNLPSSEASAASPRVFYIPSAQEVVLNEPVSAAPVTRLEPASPVAAGLIESAPVVVAPEAAPVDVVPVVVASEAAPVDVVPVVVASEAAPVDVVPVVVAPEAAPVDEVPVVVAPEAAPVVVAPIEPASADVVPAAAAATDRSVDSSTSRR